MIVVTVSSPEARETVRTACPSAECLYVPGPDAWWSGAAALASHPFVLQLNEHLRAGRACVLAQDDSEEGEWVASLLVRAFSLFAPRRWRMRDFSAGAIASHFEAAEPFVEDTPLIKRHELRRAVGMMTLWPAWTVRHAFECAPSFFTVTVLLTESHIPFTCRFESRAEADRAVAAVGSLVAEAFTRVGPVPYTRKPPVVTCASLLAECTTETETRALFAQLSALFYAGRISWPFSSLPITGGGGGGGGGGEEVDEGRVRLFASKDPWKVQTITASVTLGEWTFRCAAESTLKWGWQKAHDRASFFPRLSMMTVGQSIGRPLHVRVDEERASPWPALLAAMPDVPMEVWRRGCGAEAVEPIPPQIDRTVFTAPYVEHVEHILAALAKGGGGGGSVGGGVGVPLCVRVIADELTRITRKRALASALPSSKRLAMGGVPLADAYVLTSACVEYRPDPETKWLIVKYAFPPGLTAESIYSVLRQNPEAYRSPPGAVLSVLGAPLTSYVTFSNFPLHKGYVLSVVWGESPYACWGSMRVQLPSYDPTDPPFDAYAAVTRYLCRESDAIRMRRITEERRPARSGRGRQSGGRGAAAGAAGGEEKDRGEGRGAGNGGEKEKGQTTTTTKKKKRLSPTQHTLMNIFSRDSPAFSPSAALLSSSSSSSSSSSAPSSDPSMPPPAPPASPRPRSFALDCEPLTACKVLRTLSEGRLAVCALKADPSRRFIRFSASKGARGKKINLDSFTLDPITCPEEDLRQWIHAQNCSFH